MIKEVLHNLSINAFSIKINNRKILSGIASLIDAESSLTDLSVAIDKVDKIGWEGVEKELEQRGFNSTQIASLKVIFSTGSGSVKVLETLKEQFTLNKNEVGLKGIAELQEVFSLLNSFEDDGTNLEVDLTLARGLSYYTGAIFEVKAHNVNMGSISGGGRYDDLTGVFGVPGLSGVGFSFGVDRIYDVMDELGLFENLPTDNVQVMIANFGQESLSYSLSLLNQLRALDIRAEIYPETAKMKKQFGYADAKGIQYVIITGTEEVAAQSFQLKNLKSGEQVNYSLTELKNLKFN
jgi:histidyl-tRNA synthetase